MSKVAVGLAVGAVLLAFAYGVGVGFYQWPPFALCKSIEDMLLDRGETTPPPVHEYRGKDELLSRVFDDPLIGREQIYPPVTSFEDIHTLNSSILLPVEEFYAAYDNLEVIDASVLVIDNGSTRVLRLAYRLAGRDYVAHAYAPSPSDGVRSAALIIPGTGLNQSSGIYENDPSNYQFGIVDALGPSFDRYVLVKPNEDCLAFHDGKHKLRMSCVLNWLLDNGGSYAAYYIANSLAVTKYLGTEYDRVVVAGLSQGGGAALLNALQSSPDAAIIASGFSIIDRTFRNSAHNQIVIPGLRNRLPFEEVRSRIRQSKTRFLFTYGSNERGIWRIEAEERRTCRFLADNANVACRIHDGAHAFAPKLVEEFLSALP